MSNQINLNIDELLPLYEDSEFVCYAKASYHLDHEYGEKLKKILDQVKAEMTSYAYPAHRGINKVLVLVNGMYPTSRQSIISLDQYLTPYSDEIIETVAHEMVHAVDQSYQSIAAVSPSSWIEGRAEYLALKVCERMNVHRAGYKEQYDWSFLTEQDKEDFLSYFYYSTNRNTTYAVGYYFIKYLCDTYGKDTIGRITERMIQIHMDDVLSAGSKEALKEMFYNAVAAETEPAVFQKFVTDVIDPEYIMPVERIGPSL